MQVRKAKAVKTGALMMVGASLLTSSLTVTAQAKDRRDRDRDRYETPNERKADNLKKGAIALGAIGAVLGAKGKLLPGAVAAAGGYYLYKKGRREDRNDDRYPGYRADRDRNDRDRRDRDRDRDRRDRDRDWRDSDYGYGRDDRDYGYDRGYGYDARYDNRNDRDNRIDCPPGPDNGRRGNRPYSVR